MSRGSKSGGRLPKITLETVEAVAELVIGGMPIRYALRLVNEAFTLPHWQNALSKAPLLLARYEKKCGELLKPFLAEMDKCTLRSMPAKVWKLERVLPADFAQQKAGPSSITVNNVCIGLADDISKRAAALVLASAKRAKAVEAEVQQLPDKT